MNTLEASLSMLKNPAIIWGGKTKGSSEKWNSEISSFHVS